MSPDLTLNLFFIEICVFWATALSFALVIGYYNALKAENKKDIFYRIMASVFKRESPPEFEELAKFSNKLFKNFSKNMTALLKVALSLFIMNVVMLFII